MAEIDPQQFGSVTANVNTLITGFDRIERKLENVVTKEALHATIEPLTVQVQGLNNRVQTLEDAAKLEKASFFTKVKDSMGNMIVYLLATAILSSIGGVVITYIFNTYQQPDEAKVQGVE